MRSDAEILAASEVNARKFMEDIHSCIVCGRDLKLNRDHVDTCAGACFQKLLRIQREG